MLVGKTEKVREFDVVLLKMVEFAIRLEKLVAKTRVAF